MKKETFPYLQYALQFNKKKHEYIYNDMKVPSVTGWLSTFSPPFDPYKISKEVSKNPRSEYFGMNPSDIRKKWQKTSTRGTKKHNSVEKWIKGDSKNVEFQEFFEFHNIKPENTWSEIPLFSKKVLLAGTADLITEHHDSYIIWDIKTSQKVNEDKLKKFKFQILTYCVLLQEMTENKYDIIPGGIISIRSKSKISEDLHEESHEPEMFKITSDEVGIFTEYNTMLKSRINECKILMEGKI